MFSHACFLRRPLNNNQHNFLNVEIPIKDYLIYLLVSIKIIDQVVYGNSLVFILRRGVLKNM